MDGDHPRDHVPDRKGFAAVARGVFRIEPIEAGGGVVGRLLLRHQQGEAVALGERRPAGAEIVTSGGLPAAMQHDDQRRPMRHAAGYEREHPERAGIGPECARFDERAADVVSRASPKARHAVQLWQAPEKLDIIGKGQWSLLGE